MTIHQTLSQLASQCVLCGICIPHCPTYRLFRTENESPRGRIVLLKALAEKQLDVSDGLMLSIDHCLGCRACERVCPSQVDYASISNLGRELIADSGHAYKQPLKQKLAEQLLLTRSLHPMVKVTAKIMAKTIVPLLHLLTNKPLKSSILVFANDIETEPASLKDYYPAPAMPGSKTSTPETTATETNAPATRGQVILFKSCSGDLFEQQNLADTIQLINACGFNVIIPNNQQCCGAIKLRHGDTGGMNSLARQNIERFAALLPDCHAIVSISNSCTGQLKEYNRLSSLQEAGAEEMSRKTSDVITFLHQALKSSKVRFAPLKQEIAVHISCSLKNVLREEQILIELLEQIPGIKLHILNDQFCCGAAGSYMLQYPEVANRLLDDKLEDIKLQQCKIVVSSNIGCTLHFKQGLMKSGQAVDVIHPVRLLARQLINNS